METKDLKLEALIKKYQISGMSIIHTNKCEIDYFISLGYESLENKKLTTDKTIYRIASVSKIIVALGIMKLIEQGYLDINEDVSKYLGYKLQNPNHPEKVITLKMIMTQTSSLCDGSHDTLGYDGVNGPKMAVSLERLLTDPTYEYYYEKTFTKEVPGSTWLYSNLGCGVLACIIEKVTGKLFTDYIKEILLNPLGIDGGFRVDQVKDVDSIASLYEFENQKLELIRNKEIFFEVLFPKYTLGDNFRGPAGGLFIGAKDLSKIMLMMMNKGTYQNIHLFDSSTIELMEQVHWKGYSYDPSYRAKGLQLNLLDGFSKETLKGHFGCAYGLRSFMLYNTNNGYIFLCNGADYHGFGDQMVKMEEELLHYLVAKFEGDQSENK